MSAMMVRMKTTMSSGYLIATGRGTCESTSTVTGTRARREARLYTAMVAMVSVSRASQSRPSFPSRPTSHPNHANVFNSRPKKKTARAILTRDVASRGCPRCYYHTNPCPTPSGNQCEWSILLRLATQRDGQTDDSCTGKYQGSLGAVTGTESFLSAAVRCKKAAFVCEREYVWAAPPMSSRLDRYGWAVRGAHVFAENS